MRMDTCLFQLSIQYWILFLTCFTDVHTPLDRLRSMSPNHTSTGSIHDPDVDVDSGMGLESGPDLCRLCLT